jgi:hypothetical protein
VKCSAKYVGLDVHQSTTIATVRQSSGKIIARSVLPTEEAALLEFFAGMRGPIHVAFEEGTQAQWLHDLLSPRVARVIVCDRRGTFRQGNKGDQADSAILADLLRSGQLRAVYHGSADRLVLKELTRTYQNPLPVGGGGCIAGSRHAITTPSDPALRPLHAPRSHSRPPPRRPIPPRLSRTADRPRKR